MPNSGGRIYVDRTVTPHVGISIWGDVAYVLGEYSGDHDVLCRSQFINKWSKTKPFRSALHEPDNSARIAAHYGLSVPENYTDLGSPTTAGQFLYELVHGNLDWEYLRPRGDLVTPAERFRIEDFDGYYHHCECPIGDVVRSVMIDMYGNASINWEVIDSLDQANITLADIKINGTPILGNYYFGVLLYWPDGTWDVLTSDTKINAQTSNVVINLSGVSSFGGKTCMAYPLFSSERYDLNSAGYVSGSYVSAGWDNAAAQLKFFTASDLVYGFVGGLWNTSHTEIAIDWWLYNENSSSRTVAPTIALGRTAPGASPETSFEQRTVISLGSQEIPAKSGDHIGELNGQTTLTPTDVYSSSYDWWLRLSIPSYGTQYFAIEEDAPTPD